MVYYRKIKPNDIVKLMDLKSRHEAFIKITKTEEKIVYRANTSIDGCSPNIEIQYNTEEEPGVYDNIIIASEISALGSSLLGQRKDDIVVVYYPSGKVRQYYIMDVIFN